jgi:hypothetical protein
MTTEIQPTQTKLVESTLGERDLKNSERPLPLNNAPLQYAPENELGVVFLFSAIAKRLQFRVEKIRAAYPDCIAYRHSGDSEKRVTRDGKVGVYHTATFLDETLRMATPQGRVAKTS